MMRKNIRFGTLALTLVTLAATPEASAASSQRGRGLGRTTQQTTTTNTTDSTATTAGSKKPVQSMSAGEKGVVSRLNGWFNNPRPKDIKWQAKVQEQINILRTKFNNATLADEFQKRADALTAVPVTTTAVTTTTVETVSTPAPITSEVINQGQ